NILAFDQIELSNKFAKQSDDKFLDTEHIVSESGAPVIVGAAAHFECRNESRHYGGDHIIFIGHVERFAYTDKPTLMFCRGKYIRGEPILLGGPCRLPFPLHFRGKPGPIHRSPVWVAV